MREPLMAKPGQRCSHIDFDNPEPCQWSAWQHLKEEFRSPHRGWSTAGEFHCYFPGCMVSIGKNLRGEKPFLLAAEHLAEHRREGT